MNMQRSLFILAIFNAGVIGAELNDLIRSGARDHISDQPITALSDLRQPVEDRGASWTVNQEDAGRPDPTPLVSITLMTQPVLPSAGMPGDAILTGDHPRGATYASHLLPNDSPTLTGRGHAIDGAPGSRRNPSPGTPPTDAGTHVVLATDGALVFIGPSGRLTANTGETSASGSVALGVRGSQLRTGRSSARRVAVGAPEPAADDTNSLGNSSLLGVFLREGGAKGLGLAMSGFEDHSVSVKGDDQIVTYDDSNVFVRREGDINANTGDTDSSGLNAVDVAYGRVRSGNSGDSEEDGEEEEDEEADEEEVPPDQAPLAPIRRAPVPASEVATVLHSTGASAGKVYRLSGFAVPDLPVGDPEPPDDEDVTFPPVADGQSFATVTDEGASAAIGNSTFVIGADGVDDVSIRSTGARNLVTYDDSNVVIGGFGKVNAQIGDSDTGGAVVMGIDHADVEAGCEGDLCYSGTKGPEAKPEKDAKKEQPAKNERPAARQPRK